jgi:hypothetical protein
MREQEQPRLIDVLRRQTDKVHKGIHEILSDRSVPLHIKCSLALVNRDVFEIATVLNEAIAEVGLLDAQLHEIDNKMNKRLAV